MAENDEPLDDLRAAAMTAAAAAARVVETIARDQQNRRAQAVDDDARRARAQAALATVQPASAVTPERTPASAEDVRHGQAVTKEPQPATMAQMLKVELAAPAPTSPVVETTTLADLAQERAEQLADARARQLTRLAATDWLREKDPDAARQYLTERRKGGLSNKALDKLDGDLIRDWKAATGQEADPTPTPTTEPVTPAAPSYDSARRRSATDEAMRAAGVPDEARHARVVSDRMNGTDPALAASSGTTTKTKAKPAAKTPERQRSR